MVVDIYLQKDESMMIINSVKMSLLFFVVVVVFCFVLLRFVFSSKRASRRAFLRPREDLKRVEERFLHFVLLKIKRNDLLMYD